MHETSLCAVSILKNPFVGMEWNGQTVVYLKENISWKKQRTTLGNETLHS
jgi:hypothetical protein